MEKRYSKEYFELVQDKERLLDKPLKTKQLTYFQDAMVRFCRNKYNVIATIILSIMILLSIFVPIFTDDRLFKQTNSALSTLPPKIPLLEHLGVLDGKKLFTDQPIDYSTIDPETGLGYPTVGFDPKYIDFSTLKNTAIIGSDRSSQFRGGTNEIIVNPGRTAYSIRSTDLIAFENDSQIIIDINSIGDGVVKLYLSEFENGTNYQFWNDLIYLGSISEAGETTISPFVNYSTNVELTRYLIIKYEVNRISANEDNVLSLNSVSIKTGEELNTYSGYPLSLFKPFIVVTTAESGRFTGMGNEIVIAPNCTSYAVVSNSKVVIYGDSQIVLNVDSIGKGVAKIYLAATNNGGDYEAWDDEEDELYLVDTTNIDGEVSFVPFRYGGEPGSYYIVIVYQASEVSSQPNTLSINNLSIISSDNTITFDNETLGAFIPFVIDGESEDGIFQRRSNEIIVFPNQDNYSIVSSSKVSINNLSTLTIDVESLRNGRLLVYISENEVETNQNIWNTLPLVGTITTAGTHSLDLSEIDSLEGYLVLRLVVDEKDPLEESSVDLNQISILTNDEEVVFGENELANFTPFIGLSSERGRYNRSNAVRIQASFYYDVYGALFSPKLRIIGKSEYDQILAENPGMEESIVVNPDNPRAWTFGEGYPLTEVINYEGYTIGGREYYNYFVMMDGARIVGFDKPPFFLFGTDPYGRDLFTLIWLGLRTSLLLGLMASLVNIIIGIIWGAISAYYGGQVDILMERFKDIWGSFPQITMIGIISVLIGPGFLALFIFLIYDGWIGAASITRVQFYRYKGREYVLAARTLGASDRRIIFKHILPNAIGTIVTRVILSIPSVIFLEMNLSYLGFGIGSGQTLTLGPIELTGTSIGVILNEGQQQIFAGNLWLIIAPTVVVSILMISFNMFGNALRDALNPQLRGN
jgi:ABC-type dipeptide/oligopeptide/nickel transport system permease subunit